MTDNPLLKYGSIARLAGLLALLSVCGGTMATDPTRTVGADECVDCHTPEYDTWVETTHYKTYDELSGNDKAYEIAEALDMDDLEAPDGVCVGCHFTMVGETKDDALPIAGISCESCHGAAIDWVRTHGEYVSGDATTETAAQKAERIAAAETAGLIRPQRIHLIAANCLNCHTVPNERLVNKGGHTAGSDFELVSWSQGEVRHNLFWSKGESNEQASQARKRVLYVVGQATDLEFSLRALAKSTEAGNYRDSMAQRVDGARASLAAINAKINADEVTNMLAAAAGIDLAAVPVAAKLEGTANAIQAAIEKFSVTHDGESLAALDSLLPQGEGRYSDKY